MSAIVPAIINYIRPVYNFMFESRERAKMSTWYILLIGTMSFVFSLGAEVVFNLEQGASITIPQLLALAIALLAVMSITYWFTIAFLSFLRPREEWPVFSKGILGSIINLFLMLGIFCIPFMIFSGAIAWAFFFFILIAEAFMVIYIFRYSKWSLFFKIIGLGILGVLLIPILTILLIAAISFTYIAYLFALILVIALFLSFLIWSFLIVYFLFTPFKAAAEYADRIFRVPPINSFIINSLLIIILNVAFLFPAVWLYNYFYTIFQPSADIGNLIGIGLVILLVFTNFISFGLLLWFGKIRRNNEKFHRVYFFHVVILLYFTTFVAKFLFIDYKGAPLSTFTVIINTLLALILTFFALRKIANIVKERYGKDPYTRRLNPRTWTYTLFFTTTLYFLVVKGISFVGQINQVIFGQFDINFIFFVFFAPLAYLAFFIFEKFEAVVERPEYADLATPHT